MKNKNKHTPDLITASRGEINKNIDIFRENLDKDKLLWNKDYPNKGTDRDRILWEIENIDHRIETYKQEINILKTKKKLWMEKLK